MDDCSNPNLKIKTYTSKIQELKKSLATIDFPKRNIHFTIIEIDGQLKQLVHAPAKFLPYAIDKICRNNSCRVSNLINGFDIAKFASNKIGERMTINCCWCGYIWVRRTPARKCHL